MYYCRYCHPQGLLISIDFSASEGINILKCTYTVICSYTVISVWFSFVEFLFQFWTMILNYDFELWFSWLLQVQIWRLLVRPERRVLPLHRLLLHLHHLQWPRHHPLLPLHHPRLSVVRDHPHPHHHQGLGQLASQVRDCLKLQKSFNGPNKKMFVSCKILTSFYSKVIFNNMLRDNS